MRQVSTRVATESTPTQVEPEVRATWDKVKEQRLYTPREIDAALPFLKKEEAYRVALLRIVNTEEGDTASHISDLLTIIGRVRTTLDHWDFWLNIQRLFKDSSKEDKKIYLVDILILWCLPFSRKTIAQEALLDDPGVSPYEEHIHQNYKLFLNPKNRENEYKRLISLRKELMSKPMNIYVKDELRCVDDAVAMLEIIDYISTGDYYYVWDVLESRADSAVTDRDLDLVAKLVEVFRLYYR